MIFSIFCIPQLAGFLRYSTFFNLLHFVFTQLDITGLHKKFLNLHILFFADYYCPLIVVKAVNSSWQL